jgi:hypothetical protein
LAALRVSIGADELRALSTPAGALRLGPSMPVATDVVPLDSGAINRVNGTAAQGIGLKVQVFRLANDLATEVYAVRGNDAFESNTTGQCRAGITCYNRWAYKDVTDGGTLYSLGNGDFLGRMWEIPNVSDPGTPPVNVRSFTARNAAPEFGSTEIVYHVLRDRERGTIGGFVDRLSAGDATPQLSALLSQSPPTFDTNAGVWKTNGVVGYSLRGAVVQVNESGDPDRVTRLLIAPGTLRTDSLQAIFNTNGGLNGGQSGTSSPNSGSVGGGANSNPGFSSIGGFGAQNVTTINRAVGGSGGPLSFIASGTVTVGSATGGVGGPVGFNPPASGAATGGAGNGFTLPPPGSPLGPDVPDGGDSGGAPSTLRPTADLPPGDEGAAPNDPRDVVLGVRPAALADLGRGTASSGSAPNVLRKRFRLGVAADGSVCAPGHLLSAGGASNRLCPPER